MHSSRPFLFWVLLFSVSNLSFPSLSVPFLPAMNNNLTLLGDASITNNAISLTQELTTSPLSSLSASSGVGRAFYAYPIRFLDSKTSHCLFLVPILFLNHPKFPIVFFWRWHCVCDHPRC
ncbi:hypothetical protein ACFX1X_002535 [Malus domestica]